MNNVHAYITEKICVPLIFCSHSSVSVSCLSSSAWRPLACWATGPRDIQLCLTCHTVHTDRGDHWQCLFGHDSHTCCRLFMADEMQMTVSDVSISRHSSVEEGGKQVKSVCTLIQMAGCNFKSFIVILWHFTSPPPRFLLIWVMLTEMRIGAIWNSDASPDDQL